MIKNSKGLYPMVHYNVIQCIYKAMIEYTNYNEIHVQK